MAGGRAGEDRVLSAVAALATGRHTPSSLVLRFVDWACPPLEMGGGFQGEMLGDVVPAGQAGRGFARGQPCGHRWCRRAAANGSLLVAQGRWLRAKGQGEDRGQWAVGREGRGQCQCQCQWA